MFINNNMQVFLLSMNVLIFQTIYISKTKKPVGLKN